VPKIVEPDGLHHRLRPELHLALRAAAERLRLALLDVLAALPPASVAAVADDAGTAKGTAEHELERNVAAEHLATGPGEDQRALRGIERGAKPRNEVRGNGNGVGVPAFRRVPLPAPPDENAAFLVILMEVQQQGACGSDREER
jgi:hypothetical protein